MALSMQGFPDEVMAAAHSRIDLFGAEGVLHTGADGVRLHGVVSGNTGRVIIFLHGFPECWCAWHRQLVEFGRDHRAWAFDLRGYNRSDKPAESRAYGISRIAADISEIARTLSPAEPVVVVGHDWGGIAAWQLARTMPHQLSHLIIINAPHPGLFGRLLRRSIRQQVASSYALFFQLRGIAEASLRAGRFALLRAMLYGTTGSPEAFPEQLRRAYLEAWRVPGALRAGLNYYRCQENLALLGGRPRDWLIRVPTLVLWGERDPALRRENLSGLESLVAPLTVRRHPTGTHWVVHEQPAWIHAQIRQFLRA